MPAILPPPAGAAYRGCTRELLEEAVKTAGATYKPSVFNPATLVSKGPLRIAKERVPPRFGATSPGFDIYYELHGRGPKRITLIMGLNTSCFSWLDQVEEFGADPSCSVLVLDNRGYGNSDAPYQRYTTSEMALDVLDVLKHVGWHTGPPIHLVGVSMGGMIALEIARRVPERLASLMLLSTTAGERGNLPPLAGLRAITKNITDSALSGRRADAATRVRRMIEILFPTDWLAQPHPADASGRTHRDVTQEIFEWRTSFMPPPTLHGPLLLIGACLTHRVPDDALREMNDRIPKIAIHTGDWDNLVRNDHSEHMHGLMPKAEYRSWPGTGHAIHYQHATEFNQYLRHWLELPASQDRP